jgi:GT2 family glycosyltransferase
MTLNTATIGIVILSFQRYDVTVRLIKQICQFNIPNITVVLVDNNSSDNAGKRIKNKYPEVYLIQLTENKGFCGGNNVGIQYCIDKGFDYTLLINDDVILATDFFLKLKLKIRNIVENEFVIIGKIYCNDGKKTVWYAGGKLSYLHGIGKHFGFFKPDSPEYNIAQRVDYLTGCMVLCPTKQFKHTGLLKEEIFAYLDDTEFPMRLKKLKLPIFYEPEIVLSHDVGAGTAFINFSPSYLYYSQRNRVYITKSMLYKTYLLLYTGGIFFVKCIILFLYKSPLLDKKIRALLKGTIDAMKAYFLLGK